MATKKEKTPTAIEVVENETSKEIIAPIQEVVKSEADIDGFIEKRQEFIQKVSAICVEGKDYHVIQGKKSLAKGGAEKIASIFHWTAKFEKDTEALEMLGEIKGWIAFKCTLVNGQFVGEGRGAALLSKNGGDLNKTLKMAQKSAFIDATLRASGLSDFFTQDLEDMPKDQIGQPQYDYKAKLAPQPTQTQGGGNLPPHSKKPSEKQAKFIKELAIQKKLNQKQILDMASGKTPSQLIEALLKYQTVQTEPQELPVIQQEMTQDEKDLVDSIPF
jgi:hypothetical protein